ncbi:protein of unknown function [Vibrio tapetis subsp. tapetis]|uniref:Uncharacterized protein n=1 Tax=Vibrio tapetis subsp. tapetis TaxID=1671868 RepID=A0A2N8ZEJ1_9VIBR|nr:protein of unknown function [Vibrio tapetis subsp. tapetis]
MSVCARSLTKDVGDCGFEHETYRVILRNLMLLFDLIFKCADKGACHLKKPIAQFW